jgi:SAM-dependent methyltransferase
VSTARQANRRYFHEAYRTGVHGWSADEPNPCLAAYLKRLSRLAPGGRLLDVGCGEGRHATAAAALGFRVTAVDYEPLALRRARRRARSLGVEGMTFRRADALALPFRGGAFDVVLDSGCLHHQRKSDWPRYLAGVLRALRPGGWYVLSVFNPEFRFFRGRRRRWHISRGAYRRCFTARDIEGLFGRDFEIVERRKEAGEGRGFWNVLMRRRERES